MKTHLRTLVLAMSLFASINGAQADNVIRVNAPIAMGSPAQVPPAPEPAKTFSFSSNLLADGLFGDSYGFDLNTLISDRPLNTALVWSASAIPSGLSLSPAGLISGEPMVLGPRQFTVTASDGSATKHQSVMLNIEANTGTYTMTAGVQSGRGSNGVQIAAVGSYKTSVYNISTGNIIRDEHGNRIMAYMHTNSAGECYANVANTTGDGYSTTAGPATAQSKAWITKYPTTTFNSASGVFATYSAGTVTSYYNGWYRAYRINCSLYNTWKANPELITSVTFKQ